MAVSTSDAGVTADAKYWGATAVGDHVYFAPWTVNNIGVLDTTTNVFTTISTLLELEFIGEFSNLWLSRALPPPCAPGVVLSVGPSPAANTRSKLG